MQQLFLSSYEGKIFTLGFSAGAEPEEALKVIASADACGPTPSWITLDAERRLLYGTANDMEKFTGAIKTFSIQDDGTLKGTSSAPAPVGGAYATLYNGGDRLAVAF